MKNQKYRKIGWWSLLVLGVVALLTFIVPISLIPYNNYLFNKFTGDLLRISSPDRSTILETDKEFGTLVGNGDHCDYYAAVLLRSDLTQENIVNYYEKEYTGDSTIQVVRIKDTNNSPSNYPSPLYFKAKQMRESGSGFDKLYIVYIFEPFYVSGIGDLRCG